MAIQLDKIKAKVGSLGVTKKLSELLMGSTDILGLDVGAYSVKAVFLQGQGSGIKLKAWGYLPITLKPDAAPEENKLQTLNAIRALLIEKGLKVKETATAISGNSVIVRYVKFPQLTKAELATTLKTEAEPFIPFDINEVQLGFHILNEVVEEGQKKMETVLVAAKRDIVTARLDILEATGLNPAIIDVDSFALENIFERLGDSREGAAATLVLNMGHSITNLSIIESGVTRVVRDIFVSGQSVTKAIAKALGIELAKAEEAKKAHGLIIDPAEKEKALAEGRKEALAVSQAAIGVIKDLVGEVHRSVDFYLSQGPERSIGRVVLSGGSANLKNFGPHLAAELKVPVSILDPFSFLKSPPQGVAEDIKPAMAVAVGLALRRNRDWL